MRGSGAADPSSSDRRAVVIKGGHGDGDEIVDLLFDGDAFPNSGRRG